MDQDAASLRVAVTSCPVCRGQRMYYLFSGPASHRIVRCSDCGLMLTSPQLSDEELGRIYGEDYFLVEKNEVGQRHVDELKQGTAEIYLDLLARYGVQPGARLLEVGCGQGDFLVRAQARGMDVTGLEYSEHACEVARGKLGGKGRVLRGEISDAPPEDAGAYDVVALSDVIEHVRDPSGFLDRAYALLKADGVIFIATPTLDSWSARLLKNRWMEFKPEHLWYFNSATLQTLLIQRGFGGIICRPCVKSLSFDYIAGHFERYPVKGITPVTNFLRRLLPFDLRRRPLRVVASGMALMARRQVRTERRKLSLIVPVYNEAGTFVAAFEQILAKQMDGLEIEIIVVESNSSDGTRELAARYENHPRVRIVWQERARGKGHAVRAGLPLVTGDYVLIQDADLEYDLEDYEALLEPLVNGRAAFVLGARHGGAAWKMRRFIDQPVQAYILNLAHRFFATLVDLLYGGSLRDPFTMYKVFRRDCLYGLRFECDRFDFDFELVIKMLRKGYRPLEIPVNYRSRSFAEGKKVSFFRDPLTWLRVLAVCRFTPVDPLAEVARERAAKPVA